MNSRQKGARGEREWRDQLREQGYQARRGQQFSGSPDSPDVISDLPFHFEVKRVEKLNLQDAVDQASRDAGGKPWVIAHRRNDHPWLVTMRADEWFKLVREAGVVESTPQTFEPDGLPSPCPGGIAPAKPL